MHILSKYAFYLFASTMMLFGTNAHAQLSVTTIGNTEASSCYRSVLAKSQDVSDCNKALKDSTLSRADKIKTLVNRGIIYNNRLDVQKAKQDFDAAIKLKPELGEAYANRGTSFYLAELFDRALMDYKKALALNTSKPWRIWYNIGLVHRIEKRPEEAKNAYEMALELNPKFKPALDKLNRD